ncbi:MAG: hypothetical protein IID30_07485 [Planctomycetes bacterium]|nr:hypothetical protein [Planctomycetota bacterium]
MNEARVDILISHVIDGDATDSQWIELVALAEKNPGIWRDLAESQRDQLVLSRAMNAAVEIAIDVSAPIEQIELLRQREATGTRHMSRASSWSGWAVAAIIALAAFSNRMGMNMNGSPNPNIIPAGFLTPDAAFDEYLRLGQESGEVVGEIPTRVIVSSEKNSSGQGYELICLRQVMIRLQVTDLFEIAGRDEHGQPMLIQYQPEPDGM